MDSDVTKIICRCIEILVGDNKHDVLVAPPVSETGAFFAHLKNNICLMFLELKSHPKLQGLLKDYEKYMYSENETCVHWNFVTWCLILLSLLHDSLSSKTVDAEGKPVINTNTAASVLSISQQKAVKKCITFIIALGFLPNLLPGIGISLSSRVQHAGIVECIGRVLCPRTKYKCLVACLDVVLKCTSHIVLQSIIITHHAGDILAALFQICHAPIKKLKEQEEPLLLSGHDQVVPKNLTDLLEEARDFPHWTEKQLVSEMWNDRHYFFPHLKKLLQKIYPQVLVRELFLLQGTQHKLFKKKQTKTPLWLEKLCRQMLTEQLLKPQGLKLIVCVMLDKMTDADLKAGPVDKTKIEAVAKFISSNPCPNLSLENYIKNISTQIIDLLHSREHQMGCIFSCTASSVALLFAEKDRSMSEKYIFKSIFKGFWTCLDREKISRYDEGVCIVNEDALTLCIEDVYEIFVQNGFPSQHNAFDLLLPFYHLLFTMFSEMQNGVSFLCIKLKELLVSLLKSYRTNDALVLLRLASFEDVEFHPVQYISDLKCVFGDHGGIVLIKNSKLSLEESIENINKRCAAVKVILDEISNKKLRVSHFLYLLKRLADLPVSDLAVDEDCQAKDFQNNLTLLQQLQEMAETIGEDLLEDTVEATQFIKLTLEKAVVAQNTEQSEQLLFGCETVVMSLVILNTIVEYKNQLSSSHWKTMKECLPSLEKLAVTSNDAFIKSMCETLIFAIATHGATSSTMTAEELHSMRKSKNSNISLSKLLRDEKSASCKNSSDRFQEMKHKVAKEIELCDIPEESDCASDESSVDLIKKKDSFKSPIPDNSRIKKDSVTSQLGESFKKDSVKSQLGEPSELNCPHKTLESLSSGDGVSSDAKNMSAHYQEALKDLKDSILPVRGHGLITCTRLINENDKETLAHSEDLLKIFLENLSDEDSYIYLASIQGLSALANVSTELVLPAVLKRFCGSNNDKCEVLLKLGEVLMKICKNLGEVTVKYRNEFIHAYLCGSKHDKPEIRASSLSNLGQVCKCLKFSLEPFLQEILLCVLSLLKTDPDMEVRRSAALVLTLLLQGTGKDAFLVLKNEMKELYHVLRHVYQYEKDDVLRLHAQLALQEINETVKEVFRDQPTFTKEIRVLDPF